MSRFYDAISKLLDKDSNANESPSSVFLNAVTLNERDADLDDRTLSKTQSEIVVDVAEDDATDVPVTTIDPGGSSTEVHPGERLDEVFDPAVFTPQENTDGATTESENVRDEQGELAVGSERIVSDNNNDQGEFATKAIEGSPELSVPIEQFQLDAQSPAKVIAIQERDVEETAEAVVTTAYGSDIITKSLIPNDLGFDFNEAVRKIDEDLNLSVGFDNLTFSESDIVIPELTPIPGHVFERENVFASTTNMRLMDTSE